MKIDITKIEGYENLSVEERLKALEEYEIDITGYVSKSVFDKASSDLASYKKKYKDLLDSGVITEEEFEAKKKQLLGL